MFLAGDAVLTREFLIAVVAAFLSGLVAIWAMMAWLRRASFTIFVVYRLALGAGLLWWVYS